MLKIEDILPFFPDFVVIDSFKREICVSLEEYNGKIEGLRKEMEDYTLSTEAVQVGCGADFFFIWWGIASILSTYNSHPPLYSTFLKNYVGDICGVFCVCFGYKILETQLHALSSPLT